MFFFGDPSETAQTYISEALTEPGPDIFESELEDMTVEQLTYATVYVRMAFERACDYDGAPREVLDAILEIYDEMFCHLAARSPEFVRSYRIGAHQFLEHTPENIAKYTALIDLYAPSAN